MRRLTNPLYFVIFGIFILLASYSVACGGKSQPSSEDIIEIETTGESSLNDKLDPKDSVTGTTKMESKLKAESPVSASSKDIQTQKPDALLPSVTVPNQTVTFGDEPPISKRSIGGPPSMPVIYSGSVTQVGNPVPDGTKISATVADFITLEVSTSDGRFAGLAVGPPVSYAGETVIFHLGLLEAFETDVFLSLPVPKLKSDFNLTFPQGN